VQASGVGPPPRAFAQGVGTVFQFVGVIFFLCSMFLCCGTSFLGKQTAMRSDLAKVGWHLAGDRADAPAYSAQRASAACMMAAVFFGLALAGIGLGLQAQSRRAPASATVVTALATLFWLVHAIFFAQVLHSILMTTLCAALTILFGVLLGLSIGAVADFRRAPPPVGLEILPKDYIVPYSHMHQDPPEVRLARELEERREKLAVQQAEVHMLEARLRRKMNQPDRTDDTPG
jgi:predicted membrane channel-forming protein YqfA (hemolysin III family)